MIDDAKEENFRLKRLHICFKGGEKTEMKDYSSLIEIIFCR